MNFRLRYSWADSGSSPDAVASRTMARLSIEAGGKTVTAVQDRMNGRYRKQIIVPLFFVADWLVDNWWYLFNEPADTQKQRSGFDERHNLACAGIGFLLPKLVFSPSSGRIHITAQRWEPSHASIAFVEEVDTYVDAEEFKSELRRFIEFVIGRVAILDNDSNARRLSESWTAIANLDSAEQEFCRAAAMCGIDPFDVEDGLAEAITAFWNRTDPSIREEALAAADAYSLPQLEECLGSATEALSSAGSENRWNEIRDHMPALHLQEPWRQGYELARSVRSMLGMEQDPVQFKTEGPLAIFHSERAFPSCRIEGLVAAAIPACVTAPRRYDSSRRFLIARALGDFVSSKKPRFGILGSLHNDRQARSRAFAAEFLAPAKVLYDEWDTSDAGDEVVEALSRQFDVSSKVVSHQIANFERVKETYRR